MLEVLKHIILLPVIIILTLLKVVFGVVTKILGIVLGLYFSYLAIAAICVILFKDFQVLMYVGILAAIGIVILFVFSLISGGIDIGLDLLTRNNGITIPDEL